MQCGDGLSRLPDIPDDIYNIIKYEHPMTKIDWSSCKILSVIFRLFWYLFKVKTKRDDYCHPLTFWIRDVRLHRLSFLHWSSSRSLQQRGLTASYLESFLPCKYSLLWDLYYICSQLTLSFYSLENIYNKSPSSDLRESETTYCHYVIWPLLKVAMAACTGLKCDFHVDKALLKAMKNGKYNADGAVYLINSGLEILLLETSGPYGTREKSRWFENAKIIESVIRVNFGAYIWQ